MRVAWLSLITLLAALGGGPLACRPKPPQAGPKAPPHIEAVVHPEAPPLLSPAAEQAARALSDEAVRLQRAGSVSAAARRRAALLSKYPTSLAAAELYEAQATLATTEGRTGAALAAWEKILTQRPNYPRITAVRSAYAGLLLQAGRFEAAAAMLLPLYQGAKGEDVLTFGRSLVEAQASAGHPMEAVQTLVALHQLPRLDPAVAAELQTQLESRIGAQLGLEDAQTLWESRQKSPEWAFARPVLAFKLAKLYYHTGEFERAEQMAEKVVDAYPQSNFAVPAKQFLAFMASRFEVEPRSVGVVLPLSGKFKLYGERSLQAIRLALPPQSNVTLVVKDTQGEAAVAAQAVEALVLQNHVIAIIGPLFSGEAQAAALKAEELAVPLLALSHRDGLAAIGSYIFRTALTVGAQAKALAKVASEDLHLRRFAMLYPKTRYGLDFMNAFWDEIDRRHGEMRGVEGYEPDQTTFREPVRRLVGRWFLSARPEFKAASEKLKAQNLPALRFRAEMERLEKTFPPVVDFDAVVIPDNGRQVGLIAPALAFEDIVLTHDPKILERLRRATHAEVHPVTLMGASTWNSPQTLDSCESYCEDSVFVDAFFPGSTEPRVRDFIGAFRDASGGAEPMLLEAQAYDTAAMLQGVMRRAAPTSRKGLADALRGAPPYSGVSGRWTFGADGEVQKDLLVLTIKDHAIRELRSAAELRR